MMLFRGDIFQIFNRPIALGFLAIAAFLLFSPLISGLLKNKFSRPVFIDDEQ
jgi:hypothetical protein